MQQGKCIASAGERVFKSAQETHHHIHPAGSAEEERAISKECVPPVGETRMSSAAVCQFLLVLSELQPACL